MGVPTPQYSAATTGRFLMYQGNETVSVAASVAMTALGAQASLGYTPVNKAGDTMTGTLTVPALTSTGSIKANGDPGTNYALDSTGLTITVAGAAAIKIVQNFSGVVIIGSQTIGGTDAYICGGGAAILIGRSSGAITTAAYAPAQLGYVFYNNSGSTDTFSIISLRVRPTA